MRRILIGFLPGHVVSSAIRHRRRQKDARYQGILGEAVCPACESLAELMVMQPLKRLRPRPVSGALQAQRNRLWFPRGSERFPRGLREVPRGFQEVSERFPRGLREVPRGFQDVSERFPRACFCLWVCFGSHWGSMFVPVCWFCTGAQVQTGRAAGKLWTARAQ